MHPGINQALKTHLAAVIIPVIPEQGDRIYVIFGSFLLEHSDESMQVATVPPCSPFRSWPQVKPTRLWQVSQKSCQQSLLDIQPLILAETAVATKIHTATSMRYCKYMVQECLFALQKQRGDTCRFQTRTSAARAFATFCNHCALNPSALVSSYFQALGSTIQRSTSKVCPTGRVHNAGHLKSTVFFSVLPVNLSCYLDTYCTYCILHLSLSVHHWWLVFASVNLESPKAMHWKAWLSSELSVDGQPTQTQQNLQKVQHPLGSFFMSWPWIQESKNPRIPTPQIVETKSYAIKINQNKQSIMQSNKQSYETSWNQSWNHRCLKESPKHGPNDQRMRWQHADRLPNGSWKCRRPHNSKALRL